MTVTLLGRYAIERELGRGGMATVYLAQDITLGRRVALKMLHPDLAASLGRDRFLREIAIASRLTHPHILPLHDSGEVEGRLYFAMPYVEGESLRQRLNRESQLPVGEVIAIVRAAAGALTYAHSQGVVHRDIKPENILLSGGGPGRGAVLPLLADFGIARAVDAAGGERLTGTGLALGTPAYMSPEQAAGSGRIDSRSDIYALGCVAYEMLAGTPPFTGSNAQAIMARHTVDPVPRLRTVRRSVPTAVEFAVERALAKVPGDRFATADEFAEALAARTPSWVLRARGIASRRAWAVGGITAAAAAGIGAVLLRGSTAPANSAVIPSATAIAVLPFRPPAEDTALIRLGRDLATTVSASLDGVGDIETVDRLSIASATEDRPSGSPAEEAALARRLGARSVLRGSLVRDGGSVRLDLRLYDTESLEPLAEGIAVTGPRDSLGALTDSVVLVLLRQVWQRGEPPSPSLAAVTTRSIPALRAFLDGERLFDQGDMGAAALAYRSAMAADSSFLLAYYRYGLARAWFFDSYIEPEVLDVLRRGADNLPERERLMARAFVADSLDAEVELLREVTRRFPMYWPGWFVLGDLFIHRAPLGGYDWTEGLVALRRAVELHPRLTIGWQHIYTYADGRRQPVADSALVRLREQGWTAAGDLRFRLGHGLARSGGLIGPELRGMADSLVRQHIVDPLEYAKQYGSFATGFLHAGFPAAQIALNSRRLELNPGDRQLDMEMGTAWAQAARGNWDSALAVMARLAAKNPGTYVPRRFAEFGDPVLAVESYGLAVLGSWLGATSPEAAAQRRPAALAVIDRLPDPASRAAAGVRLAWFDGLLAFSRGDRTAITAARGAAAHSGHSQSALVGRSLAALERALGGDRPGAGRELAALEMRCLAQEEECSRFTPEIAVQRLLAARWLQEAGQIEEAVRLLRWYDAADEGPATPQTVGHVLAGPTFLARARLEDLRGERGQAAEYYRYFLRVYDQPMPSQAHLVAEAKEALGEQGEAPR